MAKVENEKKKDYGEPDTSLAQGPIDKRECRDILCCLLFIAAMVASIYVLVVGLAAGNLMKLQEVKDTNLNTCGTGVRADYPYLYYPKISSDTATYVATRVCVKKCPTSTSDSIDVYTDGSSNYTTKTYTTSDTSSTFVIYTTTTCKFKISSNFSDGKNLFSS